MATQRALSERSAEQRVPMSYEEFLTQIDEDTHAEWVDGETIIFMPPSVRHQALSDFLLMIIALYVDLFDLGRVISAPIEMRVRPGGAAREPDLLFVAREHLDRLTPQRMVGPADLIVEVISPESGWRDQIEKRREYAAAGVPEYWIVDPRPSSVPLTLYQLRGEHYVAAEPDEAGRFCSGVLPGFWLDPTWLRQDPLPRPLAILNLIAPAALRASLGGSEG